MLRYSQTSVSFTRPETVVVGWCAFGMESSISTKAHQPGLLSTSSQKPAARNMEDT